jgi:SAM-dependent methyltransferase
MGLISLLKALPIDVGQGNRRFDTKGKVIARRLVPPDGTGKTLLDIGCREGAQSRQFEEAGYTVTSIDIEKRYDNCIVHDCNEPLPFNDESFDVIWSSEVVEHLVDPDAVARELRRVLRPGGVALVTVPNSFPFYFCLIAVIGLTPQRIQRGDHLHFFDRSRVGKLFPDAAIHGFLPFTIVRPRISRAVGLFSPTFVIAERKASSYE